MVKVYFILFIIKIVLSQIVINNSDCYQKFLPIISRLPVSCKQLAKELVNDNYNNLCCDVSIFINSLIECFLKEITSFELLKTKESKLVKTGLGEIKSNQYIDKIILGNDTSIDDQILYNNELKFNYQLVNLNNKYLAKCLNTVVRSDIFLVSRMCLKTYELDKYFVKQGSEYTDFILPSFINKNIYSDCREFASITREIKYNYLDSFIRNLNYLIGIGSCNYYSDTFSFKIENDVNDIFFPYSAIYNQSLLNESYESLLEKWSKNMTSQSYINQHRILYLKELMKLSEEKSPLGLSVDLGRREINYNLIINTKKKIIFIFQEI